jgi:hypothetical protein
MKSSFDSALGVGQWSVQSVSLQLTSASPNNPIFNANAVGQFAVSWMQNDSWVEGTGSPGGPPVSDGVTFSTLPTFLSAGDQSLGTFASAGTNSGNNAYSLGLGSGLVSDIAGGGVASLRILAADNAASYLFNSKNFGTASSRPLLTVVAVVPEPSSIIASGAVALLLLARRGRHGC